MKILLYNLSFVKPLQRNNYTLFQVVYQNLKRLKYEKGKELEFLEIIFAMAKKTANCDLVIFTEFMETDNEIINLIKTVFEYYSIKDIKIINETVEESKIEVDVEVKTLFNKGDYNEQFLKIERKEIKNVEKECKSLLLYKESTNNNRNYIFNKYSYKLPGNNGSFYIVSTHTYYGSDNTLVLTEDKDTLERKRSSFFNLIKDINNQDTNGDIFIIGDLNHNIVKQVKRVSKDIHYRDVEGFKYMDLDSTTSGGESYDNVLYKKSFFRSNISHKAYSIDVNSLEKFKYSDHKMIVLDIDIPWSLLR